MTTKRLTIMALMAAAAGAGAYAQTLHVSSGNVTYDIPASQAGLMPYVGGTHVTVMERKLALEEFTTMTVDNEEVTDNTVTVTFDGNTAKVNIAGNIARYVKAAIDGANVTLTQSDEVGDATCGEITYILKGSSTNGRFALTGSYKSTVELQGLTLTCPTGAPIELQNGKRTKLKLAEGTVSTLTDGAGGSQKGCIDCKGHLELRGKGTLDVSGNTAHGVFAKEYIDLNNCTVNVVKAVKDGMNCNQYFHMSGGILTLKGAGDDGLQVSFKDATDREAEDTGSVVIEGGTIEIAVTAKAAKGIKADGDLTVNDGTLTISTSGGGKWDSAEGKTKASSCLSADGNIVIAGGTFALTSTGSGGKGISGDGNLTIGGGSIEVKCSGGLYAYTNGQEYDNYTGNTDRLNTNYKSSPKGIKVDGNITIDGGSTAVTTTGNGGEGIESKSVLTINDGTITVASNDDCINSSSHMYINGGDITVVASGNDGLDSNGHMYIAGGTIRAFGSSQPECGIDANEEEGYSVHFTGGMLLAVGGNNSTPSSSDSTQPYVSGSGSVTAGSTIKLSSGSTTLATFTVPENYSSSSSGGGGSWGGPGGPGGPGGGGGGSSILMSCGGLTSGSSYTLTNGSSTSTVTAKTTGGGGSWGGGW